MSDWETDMSSMLGEQVRVVLARAEEPAADGDPFNPAGCPIREDVVARGKLMSFADSGEIVLQDDCGFLHYCWPNLETVLDVRG